MPININKLRPRTPELAQRTSLAFINKVIMFLEQAWNTSARVTRNQRRGGETEYNISDLYKVRPSCLISMPPNTVVYASSLPGRSGLWLHTLHWPSFVFLSVARSRYLYGAKNLHYYPFNTVQPAKRKNKIKTYKWTCITKLTAK